MNNLEKCPFCRGEAVRWNNEIFKPIIDENGTYVNIKNEEADVFGVECSKAECPCQLIGFDTQEAADVAWNRRPQPDNPSLTLEDLQVRDKPVWVSTPHAPWIPEGGYYVLCNKGDIIPPSGTRFTAEDCLERGWLLLDHKPQGGEG